MTPPPVSPKPSRGVRSYICEKYDKLVRSHSRSPSQQSTEASGSGASPTSPLPNQQLNPTIGNFLAPPSDTQAIHPHHACSDSQTSAEHGHKMQANSESMVWNGLRQAFEELRKATRPFPLLESAIGGLILCISFLETAAVNKREYEEIASELKIMSEFLTRHMNASTSIRMSDCIANVALGIEHQTKLINQGQDRRAGRHVIGAFVNGEEIMQHYCKIESLFRQLQTNTNLSTWSIANEVLVNTRLEGLAPARLANYDSKLSTEISRRTCTEGTRTAIMSEMGNWSLDPDVPDLYLMSGMAGTGKTTIVCSFSNYLEERKQLGASFFCTRTSPECRDASRIVPTIAYQLARYSIPFQSALCEVLGHDPDIGTKNIVKQFERLLKVPLLQVKEAIPENLVVVIDALDECEDRHGVKLILEVLFKFAPGLPLKFFVTSRPEPEIYEKMVSRASGSRTVLHLHEIEKSLVQADIELYLNEELQSVSPTPSQIRELAEQSGSLFIYAATLVRYIQLGKHSSISQKRLRAVLGMASESAKKNVEIDALYTAILQSALDEEGFESDEVGDVRLHGGLVSTLHGSFPDFMFSQERSGPFFCDAPQHNQLIVRQCFDLMGQQLRFNICDLELSFILDANVEDLDGRIEKAISPSLVYACCYWGDHLRLAASSNDLCKLLDDLLSNQLLFWMEVLSLKWEITVGTKILVLAKQWLHVGVISGGLWEHANHLLQTNSLSPELVRFTEDAQIFVTGYAANAVSQSTPHIYISSLPLCPRSNSVFKQYARRIWGLIELKGSSISRRETAALAAWAIGPSVLSVAYSPDGTRVAFGCQDGTVGVWNVYDDSPIIGPFKGHARNVWSVAFLPDGAQFASGADDCTVKIWNAQDGTLVGEPLQGHTEGVKSVTFSPSGTLIASGSADKTVQVWDSKNGTPVAGPFEGHTRHVRLVAFSPDNMYIATGSIDCTIRVWNTEDGTLIFNPLEGHTNTVWSVAFLPDGTRIVSGSADRTIQVWNAQNGVLLIGPLEGHADEVYSVSFSPECTRLVSSSHNHTIRIWSVEGGNTIAGPLEGHTDIVLSVAFSPDGMRIVSGSGDGTIRIWNTSASVAVSDEFPGHDDPIWSIAFARDGNCIVSGSSNSVCVWDSQGGAPLAGPIKDHNGTIRSVAISPDGARLASGSDDCTIRIWDVKKGTRIAGPFKDSSKAVQSIEFSPDGTFIASGSADAAVRVRNSSDGTLIAPPFEGHANVVRSIAFSPDGTRIVSGSYNYTIQVWNTRDGTLVKGPFSGHTNWVMSVAFSPCGQYIASGSKDCTIRVWNSNDGTLIADPITGHTRMVKSVAFSPNRTCIVSGSHDCTVRVWRTYNGALVAGPFYGHTSAVAEAAFSFDGLRIVSGSLDCTIRMWDFPDSQGAQLRSFDVQVPDLSASSICPITLSKQCVIKNDGWIIGQDGNMLFWAPPEVIQCLMTLRCSFIICCSGMTEIDLSTALLGKRWRQCYNSE
ncbi:hypothetical protein CTheo_8627 [Ceratobasidium theobromae]|uniref:NACHT domain-containing protein n=1 Tax=Ceratobasidium theobromae TaxID=1582974 RepID=A0A5N5Q932_9AGAM|nr:hypothetical protein CTheo_8627 [Ceratobasidium theobromae]